MSRKVLVVDDEKLIVKGLRFSLEQDGMEVDCAYDGEEALEKAKAGEYDIILLDPMLPKMDGLEVCQQIREFSNVPSSCLQQKEKIWIRSWAWNTELMIMSPSLSISWKSKPASRRSSAVQAANRTSRRRPRLWKLEN